MVSRARLSLPLFSCLLYAAACGSDTPQAVTVPTIGPTVPVLSSVQVGAAGDRSPTLTPGETRQLWALAKYADGTTSDVTTIALWQSSNPVVATVSNQGVLSAASEGSVDVMATYQKVPGSFHTDVRRAGCDKTTLAPAALTFNAFGQSSTQVQVTTPLSDCRWTARSDVDWLRFQYDPGRSGSGSFSYSVPPNNYPDPRTAHILVTVSGVQVVHTVTQERPASCSYVVTPDDGYFKASGGKGFFDVMTTPVDCTWRASSSSYSGVHITAGAGGTGAGRVTYAVDPNPYTFQRDTVIVVAGLSGANPQAVHKVHIPGR
jgi:hypothetical protein